MITLNLRYAGRFIAFATAAVLSVSLTACGGGEAGDSAPADAPNFRIDVPGASELSEERLREDIASLASDGFMGRGPSTEGEEITVAYLIGRFEQAGLVPGNPNGDDGPSWIQDVPLVSIEATGNPQLTISGDGASTAYERGPQYVGWTRRVVDQIGLDESELVFVGYGIVAPEYGWDDYAGLDMTGKTAVILVNDPGYATRDDDLFRGFAMTYYGRWTYKYEEAARQGAAGALIVHETGPAGYPWNVIGDGNVGAQFTLVAPDNNMSTAGVEGWMTMEVAQETFARAGLDYVELRDRAATPEHESMSLGLTADLELNNEIVRSVSKNVAAVIPGSERPDEYIIYTGHWDHFGVSPDETLADRIYNGGFDNATGTAALLELARVYQSLDEAPARSIMFLAVTAEEQGLLGSAYYGADPLVPTAQTVAAINIDGVNMDGSMRDISIVGYGASQLDDLVTKYAEGVGRTVRPDPEPEKGFYYRSDHFNMAKVGVPALYCDAGVDHVEHGEQWTRARREQYNIERYHQVTDEYDPDWDFSGALDDLSLYYAVGWELATGDAWPNWREGSEFKAIRDADRN